MLKQMAGVIVLGLMSIVGQAEAQTDPVLPPPPPAVISCLSMLNLPDSYHPRHVFRDCLALQKKAEAWLNQHWYQFRVSTREFCLFDRRGRTPSEFGLLLCVVGGGPEGVDPAMTKALKHDVCIRWDLWCKPVEPSDDN